MVRKGLWRTFALVRSCRSRVAGGSRAPTGEDRESAKLARSDGFGGLPFSFWTLRRRDPYSKADGGCLEIGGVPIADAQVPCVNTVESPRGGAIASEVRSPACTDSLTRIEIAHPSVAR